MNDAGNVKGGALQSRLHFVREQRGEEGVQSVLGRLSEADREACSQILTSSWYPFALSQRLDEAIGAELGMGERVFELIGEKSAAHNLTNAHKAFVIGRDPHGLLRRAAQIYQMYYDSGHRTYEALGDKKAVLRTFESRTFSKHDCLTVVGWHRKAIEMCGGSGVTVRETKCRADGAEVCEYVCEWS
ncbi:MAG TPA: TIGR02265 family protein [Thermoanaerobaculia bacterium]|nr:TIGR02265 family protein [Thermoanaerobaculia bacterium]